MNERAVSLLLVLGAVVAIYLYSRTPRGQVTITELTDDIGDLFVNRGLRDNNPGNIRRTQIEWQGELTREQVEASGGKYDAEFEQFGTVGQGVRALGRLLKTYATKYDLHTVRGIVSRYAPPTENDTADYIDEICGALGVFPDSWIDVSNRLDDLGAAICRRETGFTADAVQFREWVYS